MDRVRVILATFGSQGHPHDLGLPIADQCLKQFCDKVKESGVDEVLSFTPKSLPAFLGKEIAAECTREVVPVGNIVLDREYYKIGAGAWRSAILKQVVENNEDGSIVIFHDMNWIKYPGILTGFAPRARDYATAAMAAANRTKIFSPPCGTLISTVSRGIFDKLRDISYPASSGDSLCYFPYGRCRCIVLQINQETRQFVKLFYESCRIEENLTGGEYSQLPGGGWKQYGFIHNACEQAVFNALVYGRGIWNPDKDDWFHHLNMIGSHNHDTGAGALINWVTVNRNWKSDGNHQEL